MWRGRGWEALNYPAGAGGWAAYCAAELPELGLIQLRPELSQTLYREGMSIGAIADALGRSKGTIHGHLSTMTDRPATVTGLDGRTRRTSSGGPRPDPASGTACAEGVPVQRQPYTAGVVALLAERGPMTCAEIERRTKRHHGAASAALHRLAAAGRIVYTPPARRGGHGLYSAPEVTA
jgi:predicted transcriptional regulator